MRTFRAGVEKETHPAQSARASPYVGLVMRLGHTLKFIVVLLVSKFVSEQDILGKILFTFLVKITIL